MTKHVAIIGASSAGLSAAARLAQAGFRVHVYDEHLDLAPARRTLIVTPRLAELVRPLPQEAILHRVNVMTMTSAHAQASVQLAQSDLIVERRALVDVFARRAREAGATLHLGYRLLSLEPRSDGVSLVWGGPDGKAPERILVHAIIGADGFRSQVAEWAGIPIPPTAPILQAEVALPPTWDPRVVQVWFHREDTPYFYWLIPESEERGVLGLVGLLGQDLHAILQRFMAQKGFMPLSFQGAPVALHHPRLRPWGRIGPAHVLLIGDAAGQVKNTTVGGTVTGLWGAQAAAEALIRDVPYAWTLRPLKRELDLHWFIRRALDGLCDRDYDTLLQTLNPAVQRFLAMRNRDQMAWAFVRALALQPRLIGLGLRGLLCAGADTSRYAPPVSIAGTPPSYDPSRRAWRP